MKKKEYQKIKELLSSFPIYHLPTPTINSNNEEEEEEEMKNNNQKEEEEEANENEMVVAIIRHISSSSFCSTPTLFLALKLSSSIDQELKMDDDDHLELEPIILSS